MVFLIRIPPASLKNWAKHCNTLAGHGVDLPDAITRLEFESQGVLKFSPGVLPGRPDAYVDDATAAFSDRVLDAKGTDQLVGKNDRPWTGQADAQKLAYAAQQNGAALASPVQHTAPAPAAVAPPPQPFGGPANQSAPFAQPAPAFQTPGPDANQNPFAQSATPANQSPFGGMSGGALPAGIAAPTETPSKARKPRAPKAAPVADDGIPPFLQRNADNQPAPTAPPPNTFGMDPSPAAPDAGIAAALDAAFRLPT
jgi:hypothetical protein